MSREKNHEEARNSLGVGQETLSSVSKQSNKEKEKRENKLNLRCWTIFTLQTTVKRLHNLSKSLTPIKWQNLKKYLDLDLESNRCLRKIVNFNRF